MEKRQLGDSAIYIAPLVFGGNVFGWTLDEAGSLRILDEFLAAGFNCIDTADVYSRFVPGHVGGESETIIGKWLQLRGNRDKVVIATKCGMNMGPSKEGLSRAYIMEAVEASLRRLQTDYIDLYQSHRDDDKTPLQESLEAFAALVRQGKVRVIGASNYNGARLAEALRTSQQAGLPRYESLQPLYNLFDRADFESDLQELCTRDRVGVIPYFSLASGFLTGKYRTSADLQGKPRARIVERYLTPRGEGILRALDEVARAHQSTPASVALAWLMARPGITAPIASATNSTQLRSLIEATELQLTPGETQALDRASG